EVIGRQGVAEPQSVGPNEPHLGSEVHGHIAHVGAPSLTGPNVTDEMATVAAEVQNRRVLRDPAREIPNDLAPGLVLPPSLTIVEASRVDVVRVHARPAPQRPRARATR